MRRLASVSFYVWIGVAAVACSSPATGTDAGARNVDASNSVHDGPPNQPDAPANQPDAPANQPDAPANQPDAPANQSDASTLHVLFHSDWRTATGTSSAALLDTDQTIPWDNALQASGPSVVAASGYFSAGFTNCFKAPVINGGSGGKAGSVQVANEWPAPAAGDDLYYRTYLYADWPAAEVSVGFGGHHPWEAGPGAVNWSFKFGHTAGSDALSLYLDTAGGSSELAVLHTPLSFRTAYRIELHAHILSATTWTADVRIYDASGTLIRTSAGFDMVNHSGQTLASWQSSNSLTASSLSQWQLMSMGTNGLGNFNAQLADANIWGGVCVRDDTWCGPYANGI